MSAHAEMLDMPGAQALAVRVMMGLSRIGLGPTFTETEAHAQTMLDALREQLVADADWNANRAIALAEHLGDQLWPEHQFTSSERNALGIEIDCVVFELDREWRRPERQLARTAPAAAGLPEQLFGARLR